MLDTFLFLLYDKIGVIILMHFSAKKLFLIGFSVLLLIGIPVSVFLLQQQQELRSRAEKATIISFTPDSSVSSPITKNIGDSVPLDIMVDPGTNLVSFVKLEIQYDPDKLATDSASAFVQNAAIFPSVLEGPIYTPGKIAVTLSVGPDPTKAIQTKVKAASLTLKAIAGTGESTPTLVTFSANTQALSIGPSDQASENVLSSASPATIIIIGAAVSQTPSPTATGTPPVETETPTPTTTAATGTPTPTTTTSTGTPAPTTAGNVAPVCSALTLDQAAGNVPLAVNFTVNGTDSDGTISKATFNFGDGQVSDVTTGGGIGTSSVNAQIAHTYVSAGTFQATAILTDSSGGVSATTNCAQSITVSEAGSTIAQSTATPTIAPSGSTEAIIGFGAVAMFLMIGGALLFFIL